MKFTSKSKFRAIAVLFLALAVTVSCALWSVFGRRGNGEVSVSAVDSTEEITEAVKNAANDFETITTVGLSAETVNLSGLTVEAGKRIRFVVEGASDNPFNTTEGTLQITGEVTIEAQAEVIFDLPVELQSIDSSKPKPVLNVYGTLTINDTFLNNGTVNAHNAKGSNEALESKGVIVNGAFNHDAAQGGVLNVGAEESDGDFIVSAGGALFIKGSNANASGLTVESGRGTLTNNGSVIYDDDITEKPVSGGVVVPAQFDSVSSYSSYTNSSDVVVFYDASGVAEQGLANFTLQSTTWLSFGKTTFKVSGSGQNNTNITVSGTANLGGGTSGGTFTQGANELIFDGGAVWTKVTEPSSSDLSFLDGENASQRTQYTNDGVFSDSALVNVSAGATLNMYSGVKITNHETRAGNGIGGGVSVKSDVQEDSSWGSIYISNITLARLNMYGGEISCNAVTRCSNNGAGAGVYGYFAEINIEGGKITRNANATYDKGSADGAGLALDASSLSMSGGEISLNCGAVGGEDAGADGGGIIARSEDHSPDNTETGSTLTASSVTLSGGSISNNWTGGFGGGILLWQSHLTMTGGEISGNGASFGGGVGMTSGQAHTGNDSTSKAGYAKISGGTISGNYAFHNELNEKNKQGGYGGGICVGSNIDNGDNYKFNSFVEFSGEALVTDNYAQYGGGLAVYTRTTNSNANYIQMSGGIITNNAAYLSVKPNGDFSTRNSKQGDGIYFTSDHSSYTTGSALLRLSGGAQVDSSNNVSFNFPGIENPEPNNDGGSGGNFTIAPISVDETLSCSGVAALVTINTTAVTNWDNVDLISGAGSQINKFLFDSTEYRFYANGDALRIQLIESSSNVVSVYESDGSTLRDSYKTLEEAVAAAESGNIIEISQNLTITQPITVNKTLTIRPAGTSDISLFVASDFQYGGMTNPAVLQVTGSGVTLTLEGKNNFYFILDGNKATSSGVALVTAINGASYIQNGDVRLRNNTNGAEAGALYIGSGSSAALNGGEIVSNTSSSGAIYVQSNGTLNYNGGTISGNVSNIVAETGSVSVRNYGIYLSSDAVLNLGGTVNCVDEIYTYGRINVLAEFNVPENRNIILDFDPLRNSSGYAFVYVSEEYIAAHGNNGETVSSDLLDVFTVSGNISGNVNLANSQTSAVSGYPWQIVLDNATTYIFYFNYDYIENTMQTLSDVTYTTGAYGDYADFISYLNATSGLQEDFILRGSNAIQITLHYGESFVLNDISNNYAAYAGHSLMYWYYSDTKSRYDATFSHRDSTGTVSVYSDWEANTYTVSFDGNYGSVTGATVDLVTGSTAQQEYSVEKSSNALPQTGFVFKGYRFLGWAAKEANGSFSSPMKAGDNFLDANLNSYATVAADDKSDYTLTLYAAWESIFSSGVGIDGNEFILNDIADLETLEKTVNGITLDTGTDTDDTPPYYNTLTESGEPDYTAEDYEGYYFKLGGDIGNADTPFTGVIGRVSTDPVVGGSHENDDAQNHLDQEDQITNAVYGSSATTGGNGAAAGTPFKGTFDGGGHTIYLNINKQKTTAGNAGATINDDYGTYTNGDETLTGVGLFGYIDHASIKNLELDGSVHGYSHVGALVGYAFGGTIEEVYNKATVTSGGHDVGGVIGTFYELYDSYTRSSVTNAANAGEVKYAPRENGDKSRTLDVEENWDELEIIDDAEGVRFGGIVGAGITLRLTGGYNAGNITARYGVGGVVGTLRSLDDRTANDAFITQSFNIGTVTATSGLYAESTWTTGSKETLRQTFITAYTGGITGRLVGVSTVSNSFNGGTVTADFVAQITADTVSQGSGYTVAEAPAVGSTDSGTYLGARGVGGIVGFTSYKKGDSAGRIALSNVYNTGSVSAWAGVGGIAGYFAYANINEAFNGGNVTATGTHYDESASARVAGGYTVGNDSREVYVSYLGAIVGRGVSATLGATVSYNVNSSYKGYTDATVQAIGDSSYNADFGFTVNTDSAAGLTSAQMRVYKDHVLPSGFSQGFNTSGWDFLCYPPSEEDPTGGDNYSYYPQLSAFTGSKLEWTFSVTGSGQLPISKISRHYARIMYTEEGGGDKPIVDKQKFTLTFVLGGGAFAFDGDGEGNSFEGGTKNYIQVESNSDRYYYKFTYPQDGGSTELETPKAPERVGYTFGGWYIDSTYTQEFDFGAIPGQNMVIYARWVPVSYRIDYLNVNDVGGSISGDYTNSFTVENAAGGRIVFPGVEDDMFRRGYRFVEWQFGGEGNRQTVTSADVITSDVSAPTLRLYNGDKTVKDILFSELNNQTLYLYAVWAEKTYNITYYLDDEAYSEGKALSDVPEGFDKYTFGSQAFVLWSGETLNALNPGYIFNGWKIEKFDDTDEQNNKNYKVGEQRSYLESGTVGDFVLVGNWTAVKYTLTFNLGIGSITPGTASKYGLTTNLGLYSLTLGFEQSLAGDGKAWSDFKPNPPTGYTFAEWYTGLNGTGKLVTLGDGSFTMPAADTTLYAHYTLNTYTVTVQIPTTEEGVTVSIDSSFKPKDYGFTEGDHTEDHYVYTLQVSHGNGVEEALSALAAALQFGAPGWHFTNWTVAWTTQGEGAPSIYRVTGALTVTAVCNAEEIIINFVNQITGATIDDPVKINAGGSVPLSSIPSNKSQFGYTFSHWLYDGGEYTTDELEKVTFAVSSTVYAVFEAANVNATFYLDNAGTGTTISEKYTFGERFGSFPTVSELKGKLGYEVVNWYVQIQENNSVSEYLVSADTLLTEDLVTKAENGTYSVVLRAETKLYTYTVTVNSGAGGSVSGYTDTSYQYEYADGVNAEVVFKFPVGYRASPNTGYELAGYLVNGGMVSCTDANAKTAIAEHLLKEEITGNITITAQWKLKKYAVWFDAGEDGYFVVDGLVEGVTFYNDKNATAKVEKGNARYAVIIVEHNSPPDFDIDPERPGSSFSGWDYGGALNITSERSPAIGNAITAYWTTEKYSIRYELDGGKPLSGNYETFYQYGEVIDFTPYTAGREGYSFLGWLDQEGEEIESTEGKTGDLTLYAHWQVNTYALQLTISLPQGAEETIKETIAEWFSAVKGISFIAEDIDFVDNSITVWVYAEYGTSLTALNSVLKTIGNNVPKGWEYEGSAYYFSTMPESGNPLRTPIDLGALQDSDGMQLTNSYASEGSYHTITVYLTPDKKTLYTILYVPLGSETVAPVDPTRTGYTFSKEWMQSNAGGEDKVFTFGDTLDDNIVIYAEWTPNTYTVTFSGNGATSGIMSDQLLTYDNAEQTLTPNAFSRTGYTFIGWATTPDGNVAYTDGKKTPNLTAEKDGKVTLYAVWEANTYKIEFHYGDTSASADKLADYGGVAPEPVPFAYGANISCADAPIPHYSHVWYMWDGQNAVLFKNSTMPDLSDKSYEGYVTVGTGEEKYTYTIYLYAVYTAETYYIHYQSGEPTPVNVTMVTETKLESAEPSLGYAFVGWELYTNGNPVSGENYFNFFAVGEDEEGNKVVEFRPQSDGGNTYSVPLGDLKSYTLVPHFEAIEYTIKFVGGDGATGSTASMSLSYGVTDTLQENGFEKNGYNFAGWMIPGSDSVAYADGARITITSDLVEGLGEGKTITLTAKWTPIVYTITYVLNGGSLSGNPDLTYTIEESVTLALPADRTGYKFCGWFEKEDFSGDAVSEIAKGSTGNKVFYAKWEPESYTVGFAENSGTGLNLSAQNALYGQQLVLTLTAQEGYTLPASVEVEMVGSSEGFYSYSNGVITISSVTGVITITANGVSKIYSVTLGEGSANVAIDVSSATYGKVIEITVTAANGYERPASVEVKMDGGVGDFYSYSNGVITISSVTGDIVVTATAAAKTFKVEDNGTNISIDGLENSATFGQDFSFTIRANVGYSLPATVTIKVGGITYTLAVGEKGNVTIPASYVTGEIAITVNGVINRYTVTFDSNGGSAVAEQSVVYNGTATEPVVDPTRTGYTFVGWYNNDTEYEFSTPITKNLTLTAKWTPIKYTITYNTNGGTLDESREKEYTIESDTITLSEPKKEWYTFLGWYTDNGFSGNPITQIEKGSTGDITLYARWQKNTYTVTYELTLPEAATAEQVNERMQQLSSKPIEGLDVSINLVTVEGKRVIRVTVTGEYEKDLTSFNNLFNEGFRQFTGKDGQPYTLSIALPDKIEGTKSVNGEWTADDVVTLTFESNGGTEVPAEYLVGGTKPSKPSDPTRAGYIFDGWFEDDGTFEKRFNFEEPLSEDKTVYAKWNSVTYEVTFNLNGATGVTAPEGFTFVYEELGSKNLSEPKGTYPGYTFDGWSYNGEVYTTLAELFKETTLGDGNDASTTEIDLTAVWKVNTYTITYVLNGGTLNEGYKESYTVVDETFALETPADRTGYKFRGWFEEEDFSGSAVSQILAGSTGNKVFYAKWEAEVYTVTIDANGGSFGDGVQTEQEFAYGTNVYEEFISGHDVTAPAYHHLSGWKVAWTQSGDGTPSMYALNDDITITAQYTATEGAVTVTLVHADGTFINLPATLGQVLRADDEIAPPKGYDYSGWYYYSEGEKVPFVFDKTHVNGVITLYPDAAAEKYEVTFSGTGVSAASDAVGEGKATFGQNYTVKLTVTEGYTLAAENIVVTMDGTQSVRFEYNPATGMLTVYNVTGKIDITAEAEQLEYTVTFNYNDGRAPKEQIVAYGTPYSTLVTEKPEREGYTFEGWYLNGAPVAEDDTVTGDITLVALWSEIRYTVRFLDGDQLVAALTVTEKGTVTAPALGAREGYTFEGWFNGETRFDFDAPVTDDVTLTAKWSAAEYTISFETGGGTAVSDQTVVHGGKISVPQNPEREGYVFTGWYFNGTAWDFEEMTVSGGMTLVAGWKAREYNVKFDPNGGSAVAEQSVVYNGTATMPEQPVREGYVFEGWFSGETQFDFAAAITGDVTLTAKWSPREYSISYVLGGGTNAAGNPSGYTVESDTITLGAPTREGYTFAGWYDAEENGNLVTQIAAGSKGNITLYAAWQANSFEVDFVANGGTLDGADTQKVTAGGTVAYAEPVRENYLFVGWFTDEALTVRYDFKTPVTGNLTLYAKWRLQVVTGVTENGTVVTVSSDAGFDDGTQLHFVEVTDEDTVGSAAAHLRDNMTLARLFDIEIVDAGGAPVEITEPLSVGISVEGLSEAEGNWGVVYVPDGEGEIEVLATHVGDDGRLYFFVEHFSFYAVVDIAEIGAGFAWWWILVAVAGCALIALILVLIARSAHRYELNFVNGGVPAQKLKESSLIDLPLPEREEEAFEGWYFDEDFRDRATLTSMPKQNLILFAKWRKLTDEERAARDRARAEAAAMAEEGFHHAAPRQEKKHKENPLSEIKEDD